MTRLLIVDDNPQSLYLLQALLSTNGFELEQASNGAEALELARRAPPDMIISDILMPVMDGFALCRACKQDERLKDIPFIFYTATYTDPKDAEFALSLGAERFIVKPVEPDKFLALLREILETHAAGKLVAPREPIAEDAEYYKQYNAALIRKLEVKVVQLEEMNRALELDITERKCAEEALRVSEEKYRSIVETTAEWIWEIDLTGRHTFSNPGVTAILGYRLEEFIGQSASSLLHAEDRTEVETTLPRLVAEKRGWRGWVLRWRHKDGSYRYLESNASPIIDAAGELVGYLGADRDITERKRAEAQLNEQLDELRRWHKATLGRETRILDLKREVNELLAQVGKPPRYPSAETENQ